MRVLFVLALGILASGCLRQRFDLCAQNPPHPECLLDAGPIDAARDTNSDAPGDAIVAEDTPPSDDAFEPTDAFAPPDAFTAPDAFEPNDAFAPPDAFMAPDAFEPNDAFAPPDAFAEDAP